MSRHLHNGIIAIGNNKVPFTVEYSRQHQVIRMGIRAGLELVVTSPFGATKDDIYSYLNENKDWISENYYFADKAEEKEDTDHTLTYKGITYNYTVQYLKKAKKIVVSVLPGNIIKVTVPIYTETDYIESIVNESAPAIYQRLEELNRESAEDEIYIAESDGSTEEQSPKEGIYKFSGREIPFTVECGSRHRKVSLLIKNGSELVLTAPFGVSKEEIHDVLIFNRNWIAEKCSPARKARIESRTGQSITYEGETYSYTIKYLKRAKNFRVKILGDNTVEVIAPISATPEEVEVVVKENAAFIHETINNKDRKVAKRIEFCDGASLYINGKEVKIRAVKSHKRIEPRLKKGCLKVTIPQEGSDVNSHIEREVTKYMQDLTKREVRKHLPKYSKVLGIPVPDVDIRYSRRSWGKCTPAKNLVMFNERIAMIPGHLTEYIVAHELCHFHHQDHSKAFYSTLREVMPDSDERKQELKNYSIDLIKEN